MITVLYTWLILHYKADEFFLFFTVLFCLIDIILFGSVIGLFESSCQ